MGEQPMPLERSLAGRLVFKAVTMREWEDLEVLFGHMEQAGCWCMWWRIKRAQFNEQYGEGNRQALKAIVESGQVPGILAYLEEEPIAWCSVAPREDFSVLDRSPTLKRVDDRPVWSIVCFFVLQTFRGQGMMEALIRAAIDYAGGQGARIVEAYPVIPEESKNPSQQVYTGVASTFERMGFQEVARRSRVRSIMRYEIEATVAGGDPE
jgi:GNAT superfamily N-acetyltransferase